ncbi:hypothetical protein II906_13320, partial [bacterium]|nr:hypothetical protein [bacterium]
KPPAILTARKGKKRGGTGVFETLCNLLMCRNLNEKFMENWEKEIGSASTPLTELKKSGTMRIVNIIRNM